MSRLGQIGGKLYRGEVSYDFVGRKRRWYTISGAILIISIVALLVHGLNFSVDFKGGAVFQFSAPAATQTQVSDVVAHEGVNGAVVQQLTGKLGNKSWQVQTDTLTSQQTLQVQNALISDLGATDMSTSFVGASWGSQITTKAIQALITFLIVIVLYLSIAFEWKMAVAAFVALIHDLVIATGVYALTGFQVSPATVIGLLTILGYSLYDTVVVFDKVRENTAGLLGGARSTYSEAANLALNQTLVRSINTSIIALLPVAAILFVGGGLLGAGELKDLALVLFVGMLSGTYSSIFIATPVLCDLKEREPQYRALAKRVSVRSSGGRAAKRAAAKAQAGSRPAGCDRAGAAARRRDGRRRDRDRHRLRRRSVRERADHHRVTGPGGPRHAGHGPPRPAAAAPPERQFHAASPGGQEEAALTMADRAEAPAGERELTRLIAARIRDVPDYPQPGVVFKDIMPLLADGEAFRAVIDVLAETYGPVDKVAGIEARGFILAAPVAARLGAGFVPIRKKGKLPGATFAEDYQLEYGTATIEVQTDAFDPGDRVLVIDDVLATGGTARATVDLVQRAGARVAGIAVLLELSFLHGRAKLAGPPGHRTDHRLDPGGGGYSVSLIGGHAPMSRPGQAFIDPAAEPRRFPRPRTTMPRARRVCCP